MRFIPFAAAVAVLLPSLAVAQTHDHPAAALASNQRHAAPANAYCYIGWPNDGEVIKNHRFKVWFGTRNFGVAPAGVAKDGTGHHHLLIDAPLPADLNETIPNDKNHLHFGLGQTETYIELSPGKHTLQLLMGDENHIPHNPPVISKVVHITVQ